MHGRVAAGEGDLAQKRVSNEIVVRDAPVVTVGMAQGVSHTLIHDDGAQGTRQSALRRAEPVDRGLAQCIDGICCLLELHPQGIWRELMVMARSVGGQVVGKLVACGEESGCLLLGARSCQTVPGTCQAVPDRARHVADRYITVRLAFG